MKTSFTYTDETDKCYGITGMLISLNVFDNEMMVRRISLDSDSDPISFSPDFYFFGNPRFSAKIAWSETLKQYQLLSAMVLGNIMCRYKVGKHTPLTQDIIRDMRALIEDEGHDLCQLEDDEIDMVFDKTMQYLDNIYRSSQVWAFANSFVDTIKRQRTLAGDDLMEQIAYLHRL